MAFQRSLFHCPKYVQEKSLCNYVFAPDLRVFVPFRWLWFPCSYDDKLNLTQQICGGLVLPNLCYSTDPLLGLGYLFGWSCWNWWGWSNTIIVESFQCWSPCMRQLWLSRFLEWLLAIPSWFWIKIPRCGLYSLQYNYQGQYFNIYILKFCILYWNCNDNHCLPHLPKNISFQE